MDSAALVAMTSTLLDRDRLPHDPSKTTAASTVGRQNLQSSLRALLDNHVDTIENLNLLPRASLCV